MLSRIEAVQWVPLDAWYAVIEVRSVLDAQALKDAAAKFAEIRSFPRCPAGRLRRGAVRGPLFILFSYTKKVSREAINASSRIGFAKATLSSSRWITASRSSASTKVQFRPVYLQTTSRRDNLQKMRSPAPNVFHDGFSSTADVELGVNVVDVR